MKIWKGMFCQDYKDLHHDMVIFKGDDDIYYNVAKICPIHNYMNGRQPFILYGQYMILPTVTIPVALGSHI